MVRRAPVLVLLMLGLGVVLPASGSLAGGELLPVGQEFQVNTATGGNQLEPVVAALGSGGFFTARITFLGDGGFMGRVFGPDGSAVGSEFPIASEADDALQKTYPTIDATADGGVVVVWTRNDFGPAVEEVVGRVFGPDGAPVGVEFQVNATTSGVQDQPTVAGASDGTLMVVWRNQDNRLRSRRFLSNGVPISVEVPVADDPPCPQSIPDVAVASGDSFVMVYRAVACGLRGIAGSVRYRRIAADGVPIGAEHILAVSDQYLPADPSVAVDGAGDALAVWTERPGEGEEERLLALRFSAAGAPLGEAFRISEPGFGRPRYSDVLATGRLGEYVVAWQTGTPGLSPGTDGSGTSVDARLIHGDGVAGAPFLLNAYTTAEQIRPRIGRSRAGEFMAVWSSAGGVGDDTSGLAVEGRIFSGPPLFCDDFESGGYGAWSTSWPDGEF